MRCFSALHRAKEAVPAPPRPDTTTPEAAQESEVASLPGFPTLPCGGPSGGCEGCVHCDEHNAACCPSCDTYAPGKAVCPNCGAVLAPEAAQQSQQEGGERA